MKIASCEICKRNLARYSCKLCGRNVCESCFVKSKGICVICKQGKII